MPVPQFNDTIIISLLVIFTVIMLVTMLAKAKGKL